MGGFFKVAVLAVLIFAGLTILVSAYKTKRFFSCIILSALQGIAALFAVNALGLVTGLHLSLNGYTILTSAFGGTPAVIGLIVMEMIL